MRRPGLGVDSPLFSGVFWDAQNVLLDDIDRIEVISGSGGPLWGANAVNGAIEMPPPFLIAEDTSPSTSTLCPRWQSRCLIRA